MTKLNANEVSLAPQNNSVFFQYQIGVKVDNGFIQGQTIQALSNQGYPQNKSQQKRKPIISDRKLNHEIPTYQNGCKASATSMNAQEKEGEDCNSEISTDSDDHAHKKLSDHKY